MCHQLIVGFDFNPFSGHLMVGIVGTSNAAASVVSAQVLSGCELLFAVDLCYIISQRGSEHICQIHVFHIGIPAFGKHMVAACLQGIGFFHAQRLAEFDHTAGAQIQLAGGNGGRGVQR